LYQSIRRKRKVIENGKDISRNKNPRETRKTGKNTDSTNPTACSYVKGIFCVRERNHTISPQKKLHAQYHIATIMLIKNITKAIIILATRLIVESSEMMSSERTVLSKCAFLSSGTSAYLKVCSFSQTPCD
jgi:uncharacterized protein YjcR